MVADMIAQTHEGVGQFDRHPEQAAFAQRGIWASRAFASRFLRRQNRAFGSLPF